MDGCGYRGLLRQAEYAQGYPHQEASNKLLILRIHSTLCTGGVSEMEQMLHRWANGRVFPASRKLGSAENGYPRY